MQERHVEGERAVRLQIMARPSLVERLDAWAEQQGLSRSAAIARFVADGLDRNTPADITAA
jgi:hypothetical protein